MAQRVACLGPEGTYGEEAARTYAPAALLVLCDSHDDVAAAVLDGRAGEGVVAIENSLEGSVNDTLDLLVRGTPLRIKDEVLLPIRHCLLAPRVTANTEVKVVLSHPQALGQCRAYLAQHFPTAQRRQAASTAAAARSLAAEPPGTAAIASAYAGERYGLQVLDRDIQDNTNNVTRFVVLTHADSRPTGNDRTSLCFIFSDDQPGLLHSALGEFASRSINLLKVESRPTKESLGRYVFLLDLAGHRQDPLISDALAALERQVAVLRVFGSYPRYKGQ
ncbi:MAG: prephenate dehydratase [Chloroflexi bacterium]|nr:prephenate dehydratase [Chloroflexota bacterium]